MYAIIANTSYQEQVFKHTLVFRVMLFLMAMDVFLTAHVCSECGVQFWLLRTRVQKRKDKKRKRCIFIALAVYHVFKNRISGYSKICTLKNVLVYPLLFFLDVEILGDVGAYIFPTQFDGHVFLDISEVPKKRSDLCSP